jgi:uncharacterized protein YodC (DUF2158 family)
MRLTTTTFNEEDLVRCYAPPNLLSVMPGNHVMLRSGGPCMIVEDTNEKGEVICSWLDDSDKHTMPFPLTMLTCFGAK